MPEALEQFHVVSTYTPKIADSISCEDRYMYFPFTEHRHMEKALKLDMYKYSLNGYGLIT